MDETSGFFETPTEAQGPKQGMFELIRSNLKVTARSGVPTRMDASASTKP